MTAVCRVLRGEKTFVSQGKSWGGGGQYRKNPRPNRGGLVEASQEKHRNENRVFSRTPYDGDRTSSNSPTNEGEGDNLGASTGIKYSFSLWPVKP